MTCVGEIVNFRLENAILGAKMSTSGRRFEIYLTDACNIVVGRLSSKLVETIILSLDD